MQTRAKVWALVAVLAGVGAMPCPGAVSGSVADLGWLEGCWSGEDGGVAMEEHWTSAAGGALLGMHKDVQDGRMVAFEFPRIVVVPEKGVCYLANPNDEGVTSFCAIEIAPRRAVFENRSHDYPQRVLYWRTDDDRLHARIEGSQAGRQMAQDWVWGRCSAH
jgi:hypothetical protein